MIQSNHESTRAFAPVFDGLWHRVVGALLCRETPTVPELKLTEYWVARLRGA
jgi:hypothetical protein